MKIRCLLLDDRKNSVKANHTTRINCLSTTGTKSTYVCASQHNSRTGSVPISNSIRTEAYHSFLYHGNSFRSGTQAYYSFLFLIYFIKKGMKAKNPLLRICTSCCSRRNVTAFKASPPPSSSYQRVSPHIPLLFVLRI